MTKDDIIRKLTSRKFWLAVAAFGTEMIVAFHGEAETAETISACIMAGAAVIAYIVGEGLADAGGAAAAGTPSVDCGASSATGMADAHLKEGGGPRAEEG